MLSLFPGLWSVGLANRVASAIALSPPSIALTSGPGTTGTILSATPGVWSGGAASGQWHADGLPIAGATGLTWTVTEALNRLSVDYRETAAGVVARSNIIAFPNRAMFFATRARMPSGALVTTASGSEYKCCKIVVNTPSYPVNEFRFHFSGFASTEGGNGPQETVVPSAGMIIDRVVMRIGASSHELTFGAAAGITIASAALGTWTDSKTLANAVAPETAIELWTFYHNAAADTQVPVYRIQKQRGERIWGAPTLAAVEAYLSDPLAASTPSLDINYASVAQPQFYGPDFMIAKGWDGRPVALVACDSIGEARQEYAANADARGNIGWLRRWLDTNGGIGRIPHLMIGMPGAAAYRDLTGAGGTIATRRWEALDQIKAFNAGALPFTVLLNQYGQNDTDTAYATWWTRYTGFISRFKARYAGVRLVCLPPLGRTTSTDNWTTTANQVFSAQNAYPAVAGDSNTGKWLLRDDILANTGAIHDAAIDTFAAWSDAAAPGKWPAIPWSATLSAPTNTDGSTPWTSVTISAAPPHLEDILNFGGTGLVVKAMTDNGNGTWTVSDTTSRTVQVAAGAAVTIRPTGDGVHPNPSSIAGLVARLPQTEKAKLKEAGETGF